MRRKLREFNQARLKQEEKSPLNSLLEIPLSLVGLLPKIQLYKNSELLSS